jgi:hypothetical protein
MSKAIKKHMGYYYQVIEVDGGFGFNIYNSYGKDKQVISQHLEICESASEAEGDAMDEISYYYE